ncbi:hypothetical protein [uncultured Gammaproteobacteria bacterium]|nr:hypothetical protein [uncultured Gammaproteobacteria bacterium]
MIFAPVISFLSHLCGGEYRSSTTVTLKKFLSHLCGGEFQT